MLIIFFVIYTPIFLLFVYIKTRNLRIIVSILHKKSMEVKKLNAIWIYYGYLIYYYWLPAAFIIFLIDQLFIIISKS